MKKLTLILLLVIITSTSCTSLKKLFNKTKSQIDSTTVTKEKKDSIATNDSIKYTVKNRETNSEVVIEIGDRGILAPFKDTNINDSHIYYWPKNLNDYLEITPDGGIKTNMPVKRVTVKGNTKTDSSILQENHSQIVTSDVSNHETKVKTKEKTVVKDVSKNRTYLWWLLLLIPIYLIYRNKDKIKAFIIHLMTGL